MSLTLPLVLSMCASVVSVFFISAASVSNQVLCVSLLSLYLFISLSYFLPSFTLCFCPPHPRLLLHETLSPTFSPFECNLSFSDPLVSHAWGHPLLMCFCLVCFLCVYLYGHICGVLCLYGNGCSAATEERTAPGRKSHCMCNLSFIITFFPLSLCLTLASVFLSP